MPGSMNKARQAAEIAFENTQSQFRARTRAHEERDSEVTERNEKTIRLRAARLEREEATKSLTAAPKRRK